MGIGNFIADALPYVAFLGTVLTIVYGVFKIIPEIRALKAKNKLTGAETMKMEAEASEIFARMNASTAKELEDERKRSKEERKANMQRIDELTKEVKELREQVKMLPELQRSFDELKANLVIYENWNTRLKAQVISLDGVPVPMIITRLVQHDHDPISE